MRIMDSRSTYWFPTLDRELSVKRSKEPGVEFVIEWCADNLKEDSDLTMQSVWAC